jgi:plastocyanin
MKTIRLTRFLFIAIIAFLSFTFGCSKDNTDNGNTGNNNTGGNKGADEVWLQGSVFNPTTLTVAVNTTVKWTNKDSYAHTVTSDVAGFDSGNLDAGGVFTHQFTTKGTFAYHCNYHSMMKGTIIVQ